MDKVLITGSNGLLGQELVKQFLAKGYFVIGVSKGPLRFAVDSSFFKYYSVDITNDFELPDILSNEQPGVLIHTAAMTQVDECELKEKECFEINQHGTVHVLAGAEMYCSFIIHIS
ncbi:MAG: sugar nucleotide-binding protein, partial [Sphingobacteriales bacterium]